MHQVRVHAAAAGIPIRGDAIYGSGDGAFFLHHREMWGPGWRSPVLAPPWALPL